MNKLNNNLYKRSRKRTDEQKSHLKNNKHSAKYTKDEILEIRRLYNEENKSYEEISKMTGISKGYIYSIVKKIRWKDI